MGRARGTTPATAADFQSVLGTRRGLRGEDARRRAEADAAQQDAWEEARSPYGPQRRHVQAFLGALDGPRAQARLIAYARRPDSDTTDALDGAQEHAVALAARHGRAEQAAAAEQAASDIVDRLMRTASGNIRMEAIRASWMVRDATLAICLHDVLPLTEYAELTRRVPSWLRAAVPPPA